MPSKNRVMLVLAAALLPLAAAAQLTVTYGTKGVQTLTWNGATLEDVGAYPADAFHIYHMKTTDLNGTVLTGNQYDWGDVYQSAGFDATTHTASRVYLWGSISTRFVQNGNNLDLITTETNNAGSGVILDGAEVYPLALHFPNDPFPDVNPANIGYSQFLNTTTGPGVSPADFKTGIATAVLLQESTPMYAGWKVLSKNVYTPIMTTTSPDSYASFLPRTDYAVQPGSSFTYTVSLRFTAEGTPANAADAYGAFAAAYPSQMKWTDHRAIGTAFLAPAPSPGGDKTVPAAGYPTNPRRYFNDTSVNINTTAGMQAFQNRVLAQATQTVSVAKQYPAQGVITWDIEGEQYPQDTTYVCSPDQIATVAPEMEATVLDTTSPWYGKKLDDAYFGIIAAGGLKNGVCLRPQAFTFGQGGTASQQFLAGNAAIVANLEKKARFANTRWGVTIFYVDSTVNPDGGTIDPAIWQQISTDLPNFLFIPEESTPRYYAYTAPFYSFIFHADLGTKPEIYNAYPQAFGANLINDADPTALQNATPALTASVKKGDILMGIAHFPAANNPTIANIVAAAAYASPVMATASVSPTTLSISADGSLVSINVSASALSALLTSATGMSHPPVTPAGLTSGTLTVNLGCGGATTVTQSGSVVTVNAGQGALTVGSGLANGVTVNGPPSATVTRNGGVVQIVPNCGAAAPVGIVVRQTASQGVNGSTAAPAFTKAPVAGDTLVAFVGYHNYNSMTPPAGWSLVNKQTFANSDPAMQVYLHTAAAGDPLSWAFVEANADGVTVILYDISGAGAVDVMEGGTNASYTETPAFVGDLAISAFSGTGANLPASTVAAGYTLVDNHTSNYHALTTAYKVGTDRSPLNAGIAPTQSGAVTATLLIAPAGAVLTDPIPTLLAASYPLAQPITNAKLDTRTYLGISGTTTTVNANFHAQYGTQRPLIEASIQSNVVNSVQNPSLLQTFTCNPAECYTPPGESMANVAVPPNPNVEPGTDVHYFVVDPGRKELIETYRYLPIAANGTTPAHIQVNDLTRWPYPITRVLPYGQTSADVAGLPIYPLMLRYEEAATNTIHHATRFTVRQSRNNGNGGYYELPGSHASGVTGGASLAMAARLRLRPDFDVSAFSQIDQNILRAWKTYGLVLADNGNDLNVTTQPDPRWLQSDFDALNQGITAADFDVVDNGQMIDSEYGKPAQQLGTTPAVLP